MLQKVSLFKCFNLLFYCLAFFVFSAFFAQELVSDSTTPVVITEHIHSSLPADWINEYNTIMSKLKNLLPLYQTYYNSIDIYAWNDKVSDPSPGIDGGAYISVKNNDDNQKLFVIEISNNEFLCNHIHRYSVIAHEYFIPTK